jgi:hypothetical protein
MSCIALLFVFAIQHPFSESIRQLLASFLD